MTHPFLATPFAGARPAALIAAALMNALASAPARAAPADYRFQLVTPDAPLGADKAGSVQAGADKTAAVKVGDAVLTVRLVDARSGTPVTDAVIFAKRIDMAPDSMDEMTSKIEQIPSTEPGLYRFRTKLTMAGGWRLSLAAKVQGETGTVSEKLVFQAVP